VFVGQSGKMGRVRLFFGAQQNEAGFVFCHDQFQGLCCVSFFPFLNNLEQALFMMPVGNNVFY
jgi:hypothetical protein